MPRVAQVRTTVGLGWQRSLPGFVGDMWILRTNTATSDMSVSATLKFLPVTSPLPGTAYSTVAAAQWQSPRDLTLTALWLHHAGVLGGGVSGTYQFNVNGTPSALISVPFAAGDQTKGAVGALIIAEDDLLCIELVSIVGGLPQIRSISIAYLIAPEA